MNWWVYLPLSNNYLYILVPHFMNYFSGDHYIGSREEKFKKKNSCIAELELQVNGLKVRNRELESR